MPTIDGLNTIQDTHEKYKDMFTTEKNDIVTMDSFYQLLVAEMQNQDPLEPTSNTEFISQMATFTSMQATQDNLKMQEQNYAKNLIGQYVGVSDGGSELVQGIVDYVTFGDDVMIRVNGKNYTLGSLKMVYGTEGTDGAASQSQIGEYGAFAASLIGKKAVVQATDVSGAPVYDEGEVTSIEIQDGIVRVVLNGYAYNVTDVVSVSEIQQAPVQENNGFSIEEVVQQVLQSTQQKNTASGTDTDESEEIAEIPAVDETADADIEDLKEEDETDALYELFQ